MNEASVYSVLTWRPTVSARIALAPVASNSATTGHRGSSYTRTTVFACGSPTVIVVPSEASASGSSVIPAYGTSAGAALRCDDAADGPRPQPTAATASAPHTTTTAARLTYLTCMKVPSPD
ncbi:hypothetical protein ACFWAP_10765 [Streptomyces goshikiensis]|uniref:hypothetical protein n=1 Tax=Streptomyces goshikiensis TaxID=1942 RepID=UPI003654E9C9